MNFIKRNLNIFLRKTAAKLKKRMKHSVRKCISKIMKIITNKMKTIFFFNLNNLFKELLEENLQCVFHKTAAKLKIIKHIV